MKTNHPYTLHGVQDGTFQLLGTYSTLGKLKKAWVGYAALPSLEAKLLVDGKWSVINDQMPTVANREYTTAEDRDAKIIGNADHFTVVRFLGVGQYERHKRRTKEEAMKLGVRLSKKNKANYMVYAVNSMDHSAFVDSIIFKKELS